MTIITSSSILPCESIIGVNNIEHITTGMRMKEIKTWRKFFEKTWEDVPPVPKEKYPVVFVFGGIMAEDLPMQKVVDADGLAFLGKRCLDAAHRQNVIPDDKPEYVSHVIFCSLERARMEGLYNYLLGGCFIEKTSEFYSSIPSFVRS